MKKLALLLICLLATLPVFSLSAQSQPAYTFRQTVEITETAGVQRYSYPVNLNLPAKNISSNLNDIRIADEKGNLMLYEITKASDTIVSVNIPVDLAPNQKKTLYAYYGNKVVDAPKTFFGGVLQYTGMKFVTYAWGTVKISSYSKNNTITITDNSNRMIRDENGEKIAQETYGAGTVRSFTLAQPAMLRISCTGVASVAVGNFNSEETDSDALISGNVLLYVPKFLAITSFHASNKVQVWNKGEVAQEKILNAGETLVFDGISPGFRRIVATNECLIQYGTASAFSLFSVPGRGNVYRFIPLGPVLVTGQEDTTVDVIYPDGKPTDKYSIGNAQVIKLDLTSYLKNIGTDKTVKALQIRSSKPITVIGTGGAGGHGATYLLGDDGFGVSSSWSTLTGDIDKDNPIPRNVRILAPFSNTSLDEGYGIGSVFPQLLQGSMAISYKEFTVENTFVQLKTNNEKCLVLDGRPDDTSTLFQVPVLSDQSVKVIVPKTETTEGGWIPGAQTNTEQKPDETKDNQVVKQSDSLITKVLDYIKSNPLTFALILIGLAIVLILVASLFVTQKRKRHGTKGDFDDYINQQTTQPMKVDDLCNESIEQGQVYQEPENPVTPKKTDWFDIILDEKPNQGQNSMTFKAPKLRAPKISQLMSDLKPGGYVNPETNLTKPDQPKKDIEPSKIDFEMNALDEHENSKNLHSQIQHQEPIHSQDQTEPTNEEVQAPTEIDKINMSDQKFNPMAKNLAQKLCSEGVVADPGAIVRLGREGMLEMFTRIIISSSAASVIPAHIASLPIFEKVALTPRENDKATKLVKELGIFEEVARAIVVAQKTGTQNYLTSARLPERLGQLKITSIDSFC
jgi:hypothetical protein